MGAFTRAASDAYKDLDESEKKDLDKTANAKEPKPMSSKDIKNAGNKIFEKIQKEVMYWHIVCILYILYVYSFINWKKLDTML